MTAALNDQFLAQIAAARIPQDDIGIAFEALVAARRSGRTIDNLRGYVAAVKNHEDRLVAADSLDEEDEDGKPFLHEVIAINEADHELRGISADSVTESLLDMLVEGSAALAKTFGASQRTIQRRIRKLIEQHKRQRGLWEGGA